MDLIEEAEGRLSGFAFKCGAKSARAPATWTNTNPEAGWSLVNRQNDLEWLGI